MTRLTLLLAFLFAVACGHGSPPETPPGLPSTPPVPILEYEIMADPAAVASLSVSDPNTTKLIVTASYHGTESITVEYISIGISVGAKEADLVPLQYNKVIDFAFKPEWKPYSAHPYPEDGYVTFNLLPSSGSTHTFNNGDTVTFRFENVKINTVAGPANIKITEGSTGDPTEIKTLSKLPQGSALENLTFSAKPTVVNPNDPAVHVTWSNGPAAATYQLKYYTQEDGTKTIPLSGGNGEYPAKKDPGIKLEHDTFFYLIATYQGSSETLFFPVTVKVTPGIAKFTGEFSLKGGLLLSWHADNADYCLITGDTGEQAPSVTDYQIIPTKAKPLLSTYTLTAVGSGGQVEKTLELAWGVDAPGSPVKVGKWPAAVAVSPDGATFAVANNNDDTVSVLNTKTLQAVEGSPANAGLDPSSVAFSADGELLFVTNQADDASAVTVLNTDTLQPAGGSPVKVGENPEWVAVSPDQPKIFVTNAYDCTVSVLDTKTLKPVKGSPVKVGEGPTIACLTGVAVSPNPARVFVANTTSGTVPVLDTETLSPVKGSPVKVDGGPRFIAISPDHTRAFVTATGDGISVLDTQTLQITTTLEVDSWGVAVSPDGARLFVTNPDTDTVSVLNTKDPDHIATDVTVNVGRTPVNLAVSPDGTRIFVTNGKDGTVSVLIPSGLTPVSD